MSARRLGAGIFSFSLSLADGELAALIAASEEKRVSKNLRILNIDAVELVAALLEINGDIARVAYA